MTDTEVDDTKTAQETSPDKECKEEDKKKSLDEQLADLALKKAAQDAEQVAANLAELEKVLADQAKALDEYTDEVFAELTKAQADLNHKYGHLKDRLEHALGGATGWVNSAVQGLLDDLKAKKTYVGTKETALRTAEDSLAAAITKRDDAKATLDMWRKPVASINKRIKSGNDLIVALTDLSTPDAHKHGEAYWRLGLPGSPRVDGTSVLSDLVLKDPKVVDRDGLKTELLNAWNTFSSLRFDAETATQARDRAKAELKVTIDAAAKAEKDLIKNISEKLTHWEDHKSNP
jgi:hypothetical protein